jgi:hypothetical protein
MLEKLVAVLLHHLYLFLLLAYCFFLLRHFFLLSLFSTLRIDIITIIAFSFFIIIVVVVVIIVVVILTPLFICVADSLITSLRNLL